MPRRGDEFQQAHLGYLWIHQNDVDVLLGKTELNVQLSPLGWDTYLELFQAGLGTQWKTTATAHFLKVRCSSCHPNNSAKAVKHA